MTIQAMAIMERLMVQFTDELACNYNEDANISDDSCDYHDNGDYSLSFDGVDIMLKAHQ